MKAREMAQGLSVLVVFAKDLSLISSIHIKTGHDCTCLSSKPHGAEAGQSQELAGQAALATLVQGETVMVSFDYQPDTA